MIILINNWKKKVTTLIAAFLLVFLFMAAAPILNGFFVENVPVINTWVKDENPSGNPLRVEKETSDGKFEQMLDKLVIKLQNFYYDE